MNWYFLLAVIMSLLGPLCYQWIASGSRLAYFCDGLIVTALICLVSLHILPESLEQSRIITLTAFTLGLFGPVFLSRILKRKQCEIQKPFLIISVVGFIAHNMLDGAALVVHPEAHGSIHLFALAVAIHRFVESIAIWKTTAKSFGNLISALAVAGLSMAMVLGFAFGEQLFMTMDSGILHVLQSLACGMIFHVVLHPHHIKEMIYEVKSQAYVIKMQSAGAFCGLLIATLAYLYWPAHSHSGHHHAKHENKIHAHSKSE